MSLPRVPAWEKSPTCPVCLRLNEPLVPGENAVTVAELRARETQSGCQQCAAKALAVMEVLFRRGAQLVPPEDQIRVGQTRGGLRVQHESLGDEACEIDIYTTGPGCSHTWIEKGRVRRPRERTYGPLIRRWLKDCEKNHGDCTAAAGANEELPARVLHVGPNNTGAGEDRIRLYIPRGGETGRYAALSHCWGGTIPVRTTRATLATRGSMEWLLSELPPTFRDAVTVARALGISYLWIDSLCIVQDDKEDWEVESSKMATIYQHATLTIGADMSRSSSESFIQFDGSIDPKSRPQPIIGTVVNDDGSVSTVRAQRQVCYNLFDEIRPLFEEKKDKNNHLSRRGWTLQEQLLATRFVHFTGTELIWECRSVEAREVSDGRSYSRTYKRELESEAPKTTYSLLWRALVRNYCSRSLTYGTDFLPAISGIATHMQRFGAGTYLAGLWAQSLPHGLLWSPGPPERQGHERAAPFRAPTWSWASLRHDSGHLPEPHRSPKRPPPVMSYAGTWREPQTHCAMLRAHCEPAGKNPNGEVAWGLVELRGGLLAAAPAPAGAAAQDRGLHQYRIPAIDENVRRMVEAGDSNLKALPPGFVFDLEADRENPPPASDLFVLLVSSTLDTEVRGHPKETLNVYGLILRKAAAPGTMGDGQLGSVAKDRVLERAGYWCMEFRTKGKTRHVPLSAPTVDQLLSDAPAETFIIV
ncbi:hypothetical protein RB595_002119 [Gaeumannomyces hyphopodioides]